MTKNTEITTENTENTEIVEKKERERKLEITSIVPSETTSHVGTINITVFGMEDKPLTFIYEVPPLQEFYLKALDMGFRNRLSTVSGNKRGEVLWNFLNDEIESLKKGVFSVRIPKEKKEKKVTFSDLILGLAMLSVTEDEKEFMNIFKGVESDTELLLKTKQNVESMPEERKAELLKNSKTKLAKQIAGSLKVVMA